MMCIYGVRICTDTNMCVCVCMCVKVCAVIEVVIDGCVP